jgi:prepilin-type N-terminal cleavage/methylation domain-containing protein
MTSLKPKRGFTLAEMMLTLGLVALVYTMVSTILVQISRYVRDGRRVAQQRIELLNTVEEIRYQLRSLYYPASSPGLSGARSQTDGQDSLRFLTTNGRTHKGVVETGYRIQMNTKVEDDEEPAPALYYREFRFRRAEFRTLDPYSEAPWKVLLDNVELFEVQYSSGANVWQREWETPEPPARIRIRVKRGGKNHDRLIFDVTPGIGASRW